MCSSPHDLRVRNAEPVWDPAPTVLSEVRLDIEEAPRPEGELPDFKLSSEIQRLMRQLDQLKDSRTEGSRRSKFEEAFRDA